MNEGNKKPCADNEDDSPANAANVGEPATLQTNFERLIAHLPENSLAAKLVTAYAAPGAAAPVDAIAKVAETRLDELKRSHNDSENQQD